MLGEIPDAMPDASLPTPEGETGGGEVFGGGKHRGERARTALTCLLVVGALAALSQLDGDSFGHDSFVARRLGRRARRSRRRTQSMTLPMNANCAAVGPVCSDGLECVCTTSEGRRLFGAQSAVCTCQSAPSPPPPPAAPPPSPPPAVSCLGWANRTGTNTSGIYTLLSPSTGETYSAYCDMTTDGGGWTLVVKVQAASTTLNWQNTAQWRDGTLMGNTSNLNDENALGQGYNDAPFTDVMMQTLSDTSRSLAWRHPSSYSSIQSIVQSCTSVHTGVKIFGTIGGLGMPSQSSNGPNMNECTNLNWGFFNYDSTNSRTIAGCSKYSGYAGGVMGSGQNNAPGQSSCLTTWGVGGHYGGGTSGNTAWSLNYHWWGAGNWRIAGTASMYSLGVFVR